MELIKIETKYFLGMETPAVSSKEIYEFLGMVKNHYSRWCKRNIVLNKFATKNTDYIEVTRRVTSSETKEYWVTIDFAKKLSMITNSKKRLKDGYRNGVVL